MRDFAYRWATKPGKTVLVAQVGDASPAVPNFRAAK